MIAITCVPDASFGGRGSLSQLCGRAAKVLVDAGHSYETRQVRRGTLRRGRGSRGLDRAEVQRMSDQRAIVLIPGTGTTVGGWGAIARWATADPAA